MGDEKGWPALVRVVLELPTTYALVFAVVGVFVLCLVLSPLGDRAGISAQPPIVRLALVLVSLLLVGLGVGRALSAIQSGRESAEMARRQTKAAEAARRQQLTGLSRGERLLLGYYVMRNQRTFFITYTHPLALALRNRGVVRQAAGTGNILSWPHSITDETWNRLLNYFEAEPFTADDLAWLETAGEYELHHRLDPTGLG